MKTIKTILILFLYSFCPLSAQTPFTDKTDSLILKGINQTFECNFDSAMYLFQRVKKQYPDHPVGYFYQAATLQSKMMDEESTQMEEQFYAYIDTAIRLGEKRIRENDAWIHFYLGTSYSYKGLFLGKQKKIIPAFLTAKKGVNYLEKTLEIDPTLYDAWLGLGSYMYWSGFFYRNLKWLPWIRDKRDQGVEKIRLSISKGTFSYWVGLNSLGWIEYNRENFNQAIKLFQKGCKKYPNSRFFLWGVGDCYFKMGEHKKAVEVYERLLQSIIHNTSNNGYNEVECRTHLMVSYFYLEQYEKCYHHCSAILSRKTDKSIAKRLEKHYNAAENFRIRCLPFFEPAASSE
ncbi:MAG: tetratricopeptide repeat protein [bacterium]